VTNFEDAVVDVLLRLELGDVVTYGEVAAEAGYPGAARAVGTILRTSDADLPWWRVVGSGGHIRTPNPDRQVRLLTDEGVLVRDGRVRLHPQ
jgi:methylated-DNA-protein-cysteine methyltransferase-like protein